MFYRKAGFVQQQLSTTDRMMRNITQQFMQKPGSLFLIDGAGALLTTVLLWTVVKPFHHYFGMPQTVVMALSVIAMVMGLYSFTCFRFVKQQWPLFLKIISLANLAYCCLTTILILYHFKSIQLPGIIYFTAEILVICALVWLELHILLRHQANSQNKK